jgi:predicted lipoprotein with Yx(FWY)xxD motif
MAVLKAALLILPAAALAACGSSNNTTTGTAATPSSVATAAPTPSPTAAPTIAATPTPAPPAAVVVGSGSAGSAGTVLVDAQGHTLYRFTPESNGHIACAAGCTPTWPPLTVASGEQLKAQGSLSGTLATLQRPDGAMQATYNGWPLYRYGGDTASGTANGQGIAGKWFAVTPTQAAAGM